MRNNKILATAIASVVSLSGGAALLSAESAFADLRLVEPNNGAVPDFATQLFPLGTNGTVVNGIAGTTSVLSDVTRCGDEHAFIIEYKLPFSSTAAVSFKSGDIIKVKASLSEGAVWANGANPLLHTKFCSAPYNSTGLMTNSCDAAGAAPNDLLPANIAKSSIVGGKGTSSVEFAITFSGALTQASLASVYLYFCPDVSADFLSEEGTVFLTMESFQEISTAAGVSTAQIGAPETKPIANSKSGLLVSIDEAREPAKASISFASDGLKFATGATTNSMSDVDRVDLGTIAINTVDDVKGRNGSIDFDAGTLPLNGKLTIIDGVFSASTTAGANQVFLDNDESCLYDTTTTPPSIPASSVTATVAEWAILTSTQIDYLFGAGMHVCVIADGVKAIEEQSKPPTATLHVGQNAPYPKYSGRLRHIKENGTKCTLFNIPDGTESLSPSISTDVVSIRVTNNTSQEGTLYATLYDQSGKPIYTPKRQVIGPIAPFATVRYYTGQESMSNYDPAFDLTQFGSAQHWVGQRATLVIATELSDISVFDLVRNRNSAPNMNMSTGATGNGCD
jgi:hypothetical protein